MEATAHTERRPITAAAWEAAEDQTLNDVDSFADWLAGSCAKARRVQQLNYSATITDVQAASEPVLLRTALHYSRRTHGDLVRRCIGELTKRYLKAAQAYTARLAGVAA